MKANINQEACYDFMKDRMQTGLTMTEAKKEAMEKFNVPEHVIRCAYYKQRKLHYQEKHDVELIQENAKIVQAPEEPQPRPVSFNIIETANRVGLDITPIVSLLELAINSKEKADKLQQEMDNMKHDINELNQLLEHWFKLTSLEKVGTLSDFTSRLKVQLDKNDTVSMVERVV